jgi:hypothetical protein
VIRVCLAIACLAACADMAPFYCSADSDCVAHGETGHCVQAYEACAFPDKTCTTSMYRYDDSAGYLAGICVGDEPQ